MITWMQKHKKYLIVTIWVSTISFIGAGFVGWGQYSYGDKAGAIAKVGDEEISQGELQKSYSRLYMQYSQLFQGNFDEKQAKTFGLQRQALKQLIDQALLINLAKEYDLQVTDEELLKAITSQEYFFKNGRFDKETYKQVLSRSRMTIAEYEKDLRKQLLIEKLLKILEVKVSQQEQKAITTAFDIADKIKYKVLSQDNIKVKVTPQALKDFWEKRKSDFMSDEKYEIEYIEVAIPKLKFSDKEIQAYYKDNKYKFKNEEGKIEPLQNVKDDVVKALNAKKAKDQALRKYIAYKKNKLSQDITTKKETLSQHNNSLNSEALKKVSTTLTTPKVLKPILVGDVYVVIKVVNKIAPQVKSFEEVKDIVKPLYIAQLKKDKLLELANKLIDKKEFGKNTKESKLFKLQDEVSLNGLNSLEIQEFKAELFNSEKKKSFIVLKSGKIVLFDIVEQKLLTSKEEDLKDTIKKLKSALLNQGLLKNLNNKYKTEIYVEGL